MNYLQEAKRLYRDEGLRGLLEGFGFLLLKEGPTAPFTKRVLGATLHQKCLGYLGLGYWPQIDNPRTFNEKVLHRKLRTDDDRFAAVEGKLSVREYVSDKVGEDILPDLLCITDDPSEIPFEDLPESYVIKPTHMAKEVIFVAEEETPDREAIRRRCENWLKSGYGELLNHYWNDAIERKILVEERLPSDEYEVPLDYKMYVFHGQVEYVHVDFDRFEEPSRRFFDRDWNPLDIRKGSKPLGPELAEPENFDRMIEIAKALGEDFEFIRVDLYHLDNGEVVFGEMTTCPASGLTPFHPQEHDLEFGAHWRR